MSVDISQIKAEIKEWQRAHRRIHGRDPGKEELRNNPDMQAKYKIWQASLKAEKEKVNNADSASTAITPPKRAPKSIVPKAMPVQSTAGPATPFSARKMAPKQSPASSSSSQPKIPNPFSQTPSKGPRALDLSAAKARASSSKSTRTIPFDSASSARHRPFPVLDSDSDEDDNPFAPTSPTRSRRPSSQVESPSKSALLRKSSGALSSRSTNMNLSPTRPKRPIGPTAASAMTPRTKARKRMRGEEVPATPGDKRRKLVPAKDIDSGQLGKKPPASDKSKAKAKGKSKQDEGQNTQQRIANPFELLPPIPGDEPAPKSMRQADGKFKGKDAKSVAEMKKRAKEMAAEAETGQDESSDADEQVEEIAWRPHGPLRATTPSVSLPLSKPATNDNDEELEQADPAQNLPSDLRTLLSIHSTRRNDLEAEILARDLLAGRARVSKAAEVWGIGDLGEWEGEEGQGEEGDWESEPEGWTGGVEM
ncbi:hypothetical protein FRC06_002036 [Ceratobasidium sp. 370]|nr:hypothetical protein FRC06_002036 [Ceratobasidium sp. 370]